MKIKKFEFEIKMPSRYKVEGFYNSYLLKDTLIDKTIIFVFFGSILSEKKDIVDFSRLYSNIDSIFLEYTKINAVELNFYDFVTTNSSGVFIIKNILTKILGRFKSAAPTVVIRLVKDHTNLWQNKIMDTLMMTVQVSTKANILVVPIEGGDK